MDKGTLVGIVAGMGVVIGAMFMGGSIMAFIDIPSLLIVLGGTIAATLVNFPMGDVIGAMKISQKVLKEEIMSSSKYIEQIVDISKKARTNGLLAIEEDLNNVDDDFLKVTLQHVINGTEAEDLNKIMDGELALMAQRHKIGQKMFTAMGTYSPAFGMIGTLIGLIAMLQNLEDPAAVGPGMAMAMITTFYGALFANLFFLPIAGKLKHRSEQEIQFKEMLLTGVLSIQAEESPRVIQNKLVTYLPPGERKAMAEAKQED
ncbi:MAG: motility protein A [Caldithrix sp.]|nr:MAG: motility protein A [Caldithrix sp.]TDJ00564.1 MAG: motility protein A [Caldithrix sp.]